MDTEKQDEFPEVEWTIVIQCVKEGNNPPNYKIIMNYYGNAPIPILKCESDQTEWIRKSVSRFSCSPKYGITYYGCNQMYIGYINY